MASESIAIDSEPIWARGIIVNYLSIWRFIIYIKFHISVSRLVYIKTHIHQDCDRLTWSTKSNWFAWLMLCFKSLTKWRMLNQILNNFLGASPREPYTKQLKDLTGTMSLIEQDPSVTVASDCERALPNHSLQFGPISNSLHHQIISFLWYKRSLHCHSTRSLSTMYCGWLQFLTHVFHWTAKLKEWFRHMSNII